MQKQLVMICPSLVDEGGHEHDYTKVIALAAVADGVQITTYVPASAKDLSLPGQIILTCPSEALPQGLLQKVAAVFTRIGFYASVFRAVRNEEALFFIHTMSQKQFALVVIAWMLTVDKNRSLVLFMRHAVGKGPFDRLFICLLSFAKSFGVSFVTDSDLLAADFATRLGCMLGVLPIPVPPHVPRVTKPQFLCGYFGSRRRQKGFALLPGLIEAAAKLNPAMRFTVQSYQHRDDAPDAEIEAALKALAARRDTTLIADTLSGEKFAELVQDCDMCLIPYDPSIYRVGTSSNFVLSVASRSVVIVSEGSWMAHQARLHKMTRVVTMPWPPSSAQIEAAARQGMALLVSPDAPSPEEKVWLESQTAEKLWEILRQGAGWL